LSSSSSSSGAKAIFLPFLPMAEEWLAHRNQDRLSRLRSDTNWARVTAIRVLLAGYRLGKKSLQHQNSFRCGEWIGPNV